MLCPKRSSKGTGTFNAWETFRWSVLGGGVVGIRRYSNKIRYQRIVGRVLVERALKKTTRERKEEKPSSPTL